MNAASSRTVEWCACANGWWVMSLPSSFGLAYVPWPLTLPPTTSTYSPWRCMQMDAMPVVQLFAQLRKEADACRKVWIAQAAHLAAQDELRMSLDRMRFAIDGVDLEDWELVRVPRGWGT